MAFHEPTRQWTQRVTRATAEDQNEQTPQSQSRPEAQPAESQSWVLFSAATDASTTSYLSEIDKSLETPGRSRLSDLGSLRTAAGSGRVVDESVSASVIEDESAAEDAELDSLDSHLPEFRSLPGMQALLHQEDQQDLTVFPSHDGLGSFRLDRPALGQDAQDQIYHFERFNPRRFHSRNDSTTRIQQEPSHESFVQNADTRERIEVWRLEQSRIILEEVRRETRRRRKPQASQHRSQESTSDVVGISRPKDADSDNMTWHDEEPIEQAGDADGLIVRLARTVVKDLLGLDDRKLSILLGRDSPLEEDDLSSTPRASQMYGISGNGTSSWQAHMLERISRELGMLANHLPHHPGAFSTYTRMQQMPIPYAGLPVIPETVTAVPTQEATVAGHQSQTSTAEFRPTLERIASGPINISGRLADPSPEVAEEHVSMGSTFTKEEWERDLDIKLVFRYLRSRFLSSSSASTTSSSSHPVPGSAQDAAAKAARVRQHHPLISRSRPPLERRTFKATTPGSPATLRHQSSCASHSTRRSARRSSCSSRHYWDLGGSLGTGSMIASNGPMGSWGEV